MNRTKEAERLLWNLCACRTGCALEETAYAVCLIMEDSTRAAHVTKGLYQEVAKRFRTDWRNVERNIRTVRDTIWDSGERALLVEISGGKINRRPTNTELLKILTDYLFDQEAEELGNREAAASLVPDISSVVEQIIAPYREVNRQMVLLISEMDKNNKTLMDLIQRLHDLVLKSRER